MNSIIIFGEGMKENPNKIYAYVKFFNSLIRHIN